MKDNKKNHLYNTIRYLEAFIGSGVNLYVEMNRGNRRKSFVYREPYFVNEKDVYNQEIEISNEVEHNCTCPECGEEFYEMVEFSANAEIEDNSDLRISMNEIIDYIEGVNANKGKAFLSSINLRDELKFIKGTILEISYLIDDALSMTDETEEMRDIEVWLPISKTDDVDKNGIDSEERQKYLSK